MCTAKTPVNLVLRSMVSLHKILKILLGIRTRRRLFSCAKTFPPIDTGEISFVTFFSFCTPDSFRKGTNLIEREQYPLKVYQLFLTEIG